MYIRIYHPRNSMLTRSLGPVGPITFSTASVNSRAAQVAYLVENKWRNWWGVVQHKWRNWRGVSSTSSVTGGEYPAQLV